MLTLSQSLQSLLIFTFLISVVIVIMLFQDWDLVVLTQNYLKLLLAYLRERESGLLIHCISGWDRTPLFVSLLRLSLWADGKIHKSLDADQVNYKTQLNTHHLKMND